MGWGSDENEAVQGSRWHLINAPSTDRGSDLLTSRA